MARSQDKVDHDTFMHAVQQMKALSSIATHSMRIEQYGLTCYLERQGCTYACPLTISHGMLYCVVAERQLTRIDCPSLLAVLDKLFYIGLARSVSCYGTHGECGI